MNNNKLNDNLDEEFVSRIFRDDEYGSEEDDFPLLDMPQGLHEKLYRIPRRRHLVTWAAAGSIAASCLLAAVLMFAKQTPTPSAEVMQAQQDLIETFRYLSVASEKANQSVLTTLNVQLQKTTLLPVVDVVRSI